MKKRILSSIAATLMASSVLFTTAFAAQDEGNGNDIEMRVAVSNSLQNAGNSDTLAEEYLPLYTKAGTKLGYLIPLEREGMCNGYIISMVKDNMYQTLTIAEGPVNADTVAILKDSMNNGNIIYDFPFNFYIYGDDNEPLVLTDNNRLLQVEDMEAVCYNDDHSVDLDQYMYLLCSDNIQPVADIEIASLTKWQQGSFVNVGSYYGGYQDWLHSQLSGARQVSQSYADRACGVAAANNVAIYLAQNMSGKSNLYNKGSLTIANCTENMRDIYDYITPAVWGIPDINTLKSKFESFASSRGVSLPGSKSSNGWNKTTVIQYISGGLNANSPVLLLTWNTPISELSQHWVTITRLFKDTTGANLMTTSNWGSMKTYNFDTWFDAGSIYQGVIYFK